MKSNLNSWRMTPGLLYQVQHSRHLDIDDLCPLLLEMLEGGVDNIDNRVLRDIPLDQRGELAEARPGDCCAAEPVLEAR